LHSAVFLGLNFLRKNRRLKRKEPPGAMLCYHGRLITPSACPHIVGFHGFLRFLAECEFAFRHFSIELESGAVVSMVHNPAR